MLQADCVIIFFFRYEHNGPVNTRIYAGSMLQVAVEKSSEKRFVFGFKVLVEALYILEYFFGWLQFASGKQLLPILFFFLVLPHFFCLVSLQHT